MKHSKLFSAVALGVAVAGAGMLPANDYSPISSAYAQSVPTLSNLDHCVSKQEFVERANNEKQFLLVKGDRHGAYGKQVVNLTSIYTGSEDLKSGYEVIKSPEGTYCKVDTISDIILLEARKNGIDGRTIMPANMQDIKGSLTRAIVLASEKGENPILQFSSKFENTGNIARVTITGSPGNNGVIMYTDNKGMVQEASTLYGVTYLTAAVETLDKNISAVRLASLNP